MTQTDSYEISPAELAEKLKNSGSIVLLDVRTPEEYAAGHLADVLLLPVQELSGETLSGIGLGEDAKNKNIVVYCRTGVRSARAYTMMSSWGYANVKNLSGGITRWQSENYPITE
mgnify:CR=1 FL=1